MGKFIFGLSRIGAWDRLAQLQFVKFKILAYKYQNRNSIKNMLISSKNKNNNNNGKNLNN